MHAIIDSKHRLRTERILRVKVQLKEDMQWIFGKLWQFSKLVFYKCSHCYPSGKEDDDDEQRPLLRN